MTRAIPRDPLLDSTIAVYLDPYRAISRTAQRLKSDVFLTRLMLQKTVCLTGPHAAALFYDENRFMRAGVAPGWLQKSLFGQGGIQTTDDHEHKVRKGVFLSLGRTARIEDLLQLTLGLLDAAAERWARSSYIVLYSEVQEVLTRAVCAWAGISLRDREAKERTRQLSALFDQAAHFPLGNFRARRARVEAEEWISAIIDEVRSGRSSYPQQSPVTAFASLHDSQGKLLDSRTAAVEVLNMLRPTVAVAVYIVFVAHALYSFPRFADRIRSGDTEFLRNFVEEVRRFYPFFPSVMARVREGFEWDGYSFEQGWTAVLDLYGINHDSRLWHAPDDFRPERFQDEMPSLFSFVPQGGGDARLTHRCPGEGITRALMRVFAEFLTQRVSYEVPNQDLRLDMSRLPALPRSKFVLTKLKVFPASMPGVRDERYFHSPPAAPG